jgi:hypothetical protein
MERDVIDAEKAQLRTPASESERRSRVESPRIAKKIRSGKRLGP